MNTLFILNDPPYGTERCYNALRLAQALLNASPGATIKLFLMADAIAAAKANQKTPAGYYNIELMLKRVLSSKGHVLVCGTCLDARGYQDSELVEGARRSTMGELAEATVEADKVLVF
jgi:uncharacterized protein involved in oxidation of intracellular sulfur